MMKILFIIFLLLFLFSTFNFAQAKTADWQTYKGVSEEFTVEFPAQPKSSEIKELKTRKEYGTLYKTYFDKTFYFVVACKNDECPQAKVIQSLKFKAQNTADSQFEEKPLDNKTVETSFIDTEKFVHKIRQLKTEKTYYILHAVSEVLDIQDVNRFFSSFQPKTPNEKAKNSEVEKYKSPLVSDPLDLTLPSTTKTPPQTAIAPTVSSETPVKQNGQTSGVTILTKPRANYTDAALYYEITGEVLLRVVFSAKGEITTITPLRKLPFGLTEQATLAAKEITFKPAMRNGTPYSIVKPVIYQFTIY
jgi:hypothetical protein